MPKLCTAVVCLFLAMPGITQAQGFETVSIRAAVSDGSATMRVRFLPNGDLHATAVSVLSLLQLAYDVPVNPTPRLSGLPAWRESYNIEAKAPADALPASLHPTEARARRQRLIRGLLTEHFKLRMRIEEKTMPAYVLTVAAGGARLRQSDLSDRDCTLDTDTADTCHGFAVGRGHPLTARAIDMDDLAVYIENWTDLPVINRTSLNGLYTVQTDGWRPMRLPPPPPGNVPAATVDDLPTLFTVLGRLGLDLQRQESTVPFYIVERIERP